MIILVTPNRKPDGAVASIQDVWQHDHGQVRAETLHDVRDHEDRIPQGQDSNPKP